MITLDRLALQLQDTLYFGGFKTRVADKSEILAVPLCEAVLLPANEQGEGEMRSLQERVQIRGYAGAHVISLRCTVESGALIEPAKAA